MKRFAFCAVLLLCMLAVTTCKKENANAYRYLCRKMIVRNLSVRVLVTPGAAPDSTVTTFTYTQQGLLDSITQTFDNEVAKTSFTTYKWFSGGVVVTENARVTPSVTTYFVNNRGYATKKIFKGACDTLLYTYNDAGYLSLISDWGGCLGADTSYAAYTYNPYGLVDSIYSYYSYDGNISNQSLTTYSYTYISGHMYPFTMYNDISQIAYSYPSFLGKGYTTIPATITSIETSFSPFLLPDTMVTTHNYTFDQLGRITSDLMTASQTGTYQYNYEYY